MKADDRDRQAVEHTLPVGGQIEGGEQEPPDGVDRALQLATTTVEAGARGLVRKEIAVLRPFADQDGLFVPALGRADQRHRHQFGIGADRGRSRPPVQRRQAVPAFVDEHVGPQAEVLETGDDVRYHRGEPPSGWSGVKSRSPTRCEAHLASGSTSTLTD
jgi:hypothetical protein